MEKRDLCDTVRADISKVSLYDRSNNMTLCQVQSDQIICFAFDE